MKTLPPDPLAKRLVFVTGDKGGVGKSFTARTLVQHHLDTNRPCHAYDIDPVNPTLHQYYPENTIRLNLEEPGALDQIRNDLEFNQLLLVDCAARSLHELDGWFRELGLIQQRRDLHLAIKAHSQGRHHEWFQHGNSPRRRRGRCRIHISFKTV